MAQGPGDGLGRLPPTLPCSDWSFLKDPGAWPATRYSVCHETQMQEGVKMASPPEKAGVVWESEAKSSPSCWDLSFHPSVPLSWVQQQLLDFPSMHFWCGLPLVSLRNSRTRLVLETRPGRRRVGNRPRQVGAP